MLLADEEAASEVRLGRAREPRDDGKENLFTWMGYQVHPDCGATRPFGFKTQTTSFCGVLFKKRPPCVRPGSNPQTRYTLSRPLVVLVGVQRNLESPVVPSSTLFLTRNN